MNPTTSTASVEDVEDTVLAVLSAVLAEPEDALRAEPQLGTHDWDSLASLEALVQLEQRLDVALDLRDYHAARAIDDLVELIRATRENRRKNRSAHARR
jgi:acyl carrier protein